MSFLPDPLRMLVKSPFLFDFTSDGPLPFALRQKFFWGCVELPGEHLLKSKQVLMTGATSGVGLEASRQLLKLGTRLIMGIRNIKKAEKLKKDLEAEITGSSIQILPVDMASFQSIDHFISILKEGDIQIDIAILNAGFFSRGNSPTSDGYDPLFQVNFLSTAYFSMLLMPILRRPSAVSRVVFISSEGHAWADTSSTETLSFEEFKGVRSEDEENNYCLSKLFIALFAQRLAEYTNPDELVVVTTTPGFCASSFFPDSMGLLTRIIKVISARSVERGGRLHVQAAITDASIAHGAYFRDGTPSSLSRFAESKEGKALSKHLWQEVQNFAKSRGKTFNS
ncbi:NAD(P)-binding protein [Patellaria atrata CBS 101060]|uniref:NAD(P)-binding protein n=1 Tax=Patellaria atrata CBS 101060 TaxID=1346257 RepID=A0A9P4VLV3_9PEZI|nr:NAD(P)-binding protein [Patellaria atrata CBS 101060]